MVNADGTVDYTHDGSETVADSFTYTIDDLSGATSNTVTVNLTITPVNDAPVAVADSFTVTEGSTTNLNLAANDSDADDGLDLSSITIVSGPTNGSIAVNTDGTVDYTHDGSETVADSFTYTIDDLAGSTSNTVTVNLTVTPVNDAPIAVADSFTVIEGSTTNLNLAANDTDADDGLDLTSINIVSGPSNGSIVVNADGTVDYTHDGSETVADSFTYTIDDQSGVTSNTVTVNLTVTPVNDTPTGSVTIDNLTPVEGDTLTASNTLVDADGLSGPINYQWYLDGIAIGGATGTTYTVVPADIGGVITVVAGYTDDQGSFESVSSAPTAAVTNVINAPVIGGNSTGAVTEDVDPDADGLLEVGGALTISDPDVGESSFQTGTIVGTYGRLTIDVDGSWRYAADNTQAAIQQLDAGESLTDLLTVTTADGTAHTITITINGAADAPVIDESPGPIDEGEGDPDPEDEDDPVETDQIEEPPVEESLPVTEESGQQDISPSSGPGIVNTQSTLPHRLVAAISRMAPVMVFRDADASPSENVGSLNFMTRDPASPKEMHFAPSATVFFSPEVMAQALDHLQQQIDDSMDLDANQGQLIIGAAAGLGASVMVGYVVWAFRGASLLLGALSAMPMWRCFDPLPVLIGNDKKRDEDDEEKSGEQESEDDEKRVRDLLDSEQAVNAHRAPKGRGK